MTRALSLTLVLLTTAALVFPGSGCSKKSDSQPNPEFETTIAGAILLGAPEPWRT